MAVSGGKSGPVISTAAAQGPLAGGGVRRTLARAHPPLFGSGADCNEEPAGGSLRLAVQRRSLAPVLVKRRPLAEGAVTVDGRGIQYLPADISGTRLKKVQPQGFVRLAGGRKTT